MKLKAEIQSDGLRCFPDTKYMGSKNRVLEFLTGTFETLDFETVLDAFSGSGCVSYALKDMGKTVYSNDFLNFCFQITKATVENNKTILDSSDIALLLGKNPHAQGFIRQTYSGLYFEDDDLDFLDNIRANIQAMPDDYKKALSLAALSRACMKKRPRGLFTTTGRKGWDGRRDLKLTMREQFLNAVKAYNDSVFDNGKKGKAFNSDIFALDCPEVDLVYMDTPYVSHFSDCDYTRRYHFVEAMCRDWQGVELMPKTKTKKMRSLPTAFSTKLTAVDSFRRLFARFPNSILAVSYSSNCIPDKKTMTNLLKEVRDDVKVLSTNLKYSHGNHQAKVGENNNEVEEYLFIAK